MKRNILIGVIVFVMMGVTALALLAQNSVDDTGTSNNPHVNDRANACFSGGSLAGTCDGPAEWTCGWYLIRYEYGLSQFFPSRECGTTGREIGTNGSGNTTATRTGSGGGIPGPILTLSAVPTSTRIPPTATEVRPTFTPWSDQPTATPHTGGCVCGD